MTRGGVWVHKEIRVGSDRDTMGLTGRSGMRVGKGVRIARMNGAWIKGGGEQESRGDAWMG